MSDITEELLNLTAIDKILEEIKEKINPITLLGLSDVSKACIIGLTIQKEKRPILLVTYNELQAQNLNRNLKKIINNVTYIPKKDIITYEYDAQSMDILYSRIEGIIRLYNEEQDVFIVSIETLMQQILSKKIMKNNILKIMVANEYNIEEIKEKLINLGYERYDLVEGKGTFSVRGDILDIAVSNKKGIRIEFFGDEVDQIRYFDIQSQRSTENINQIKIFPISEEIEKEPKETLIDYLPKNSIIAFDEINKIELRSENILNDNVLLIKDLVEKKKNVPYMLEHMQNMECIEKEVSKFQVINLEFQDIIANKENTITLEHGDIEDIGKIFAKKNEEEKDKKAYKPKTRRSLEFREAEKITFSDLRIRRLCSS